MFQKRLIGKRILTRDQLAILNDVALPWGDYTYVTSRRKQGGVGVEEDLATDLFRLPLLLFGSRKDRHLISGIDPILRLCPRPVVIPGLQQVDHLRRIGKRREKRNRAVAEHRRRLGSLMKVSQHDAGAGIIEKIDHRAVAAGDENSVILIQTRRDDIGDPRRIFEPTQTVFELQIVLKLGLVAAEELGDG